MTCIVGVRDGTGAVILGADSASMCSLDVQVRADEKAFAVGPYLMGFTSSWRMGQLLRYRLKPPDAPLVAEHLHEFMATGFVDAVRECLKAGGFATKSHEAESGGTFLVAIRGRLFAIYDDYQVAEFHDFAAIGCGFNYALGSLASTSGFTESRVRTALEVAARFSAGVRPPFVLVRSGEP